MTDATKTFKIPPAGTVPRLGNPLDLHYYEVAVGGGWTVMVDANNRDQATRIAARCGYTVRSVNMVA